MSSDFVQIITSQDIEDFFNALGDYQESLGEHNHLLTSVFAYIHLLRSYVLEEGNEILFVAKDDIHRTHDSSQVPYHDPKYMKLVVQTAEHGDALTEADSVPDVIFVNGEYFRRTTN